MEGLRSKRGCKRQRKCGRGWDSGDEMERLKDWRDWRTGVVERFQGTYEVNKSKIGVDTIYFSGVVNVHLLALRGGE